MIVNGGIVVGRDDGSRVALPERGGPRMAARSLTERVEILEQKVDALQTLPDRVTSLESQILRLRGEMRDGFSTIHEQFEGIDRRFEQVERRIQEGDEETRRYMRVLHEEVLTRISLLQACPP